MNVNEAIAGLQIVGRQMIEDDLVWGNAGNISMRIGPERFLITASGSSLGSLEKDDLIECSLSGEPVNLHGRKPSKEVSMHAAVYRRRPDVGTVLHAHPFYGLIMACSKDDVPRNWFVENMYYQERVARVSYFHPGSTALATAVEEKITLANLLIMENHGILACDVNSKEAYLALHSLEIVSKMYVTSNAAGISIPGLSEELVREFLEESNYKPRREWPSS